MPQAGNFADPEYLLPPEQSVQAPCSTAASAWDALPSHVMTHEEAFEAGWNAALADIDAELYRGQKLNYNPDRALTIKTWRELHAIAREKAEATKRMCFHFAQKLNVALGLNENELAFLESIGANVSRPSND